MTSGESSFFVLYKALLQNDLKKDSLSKCFDLEIENRRQGRFSKNDGHNDLASEDVPFLLVDFMLAVCHELLDEDRLNNLEVAKELYFRFFERLVQYRLMPADRPEAKVLKRLLVEDHADEEEERLLLWLQRPLRDLKIERMKKIRQMKADLSSLSIPDSSSSEDAVLVYWFQCLQLHFLVALDNVSLLLQEIELLRTGSQSSKREIEPVEEKSKVSKITQPFKLIRDRRTIAADVFKPDYNLPTMTIDEYLELEMKRGNIISGGGNTNNPTQDEDSESFLEAKLKKDREFDEFKDMYKRGSGNTYNRS